MSPELARHLVRPLLAKHPLPWRVEQDWTFELYDAKDQLVMKLMSAAEAEELIDFATDTAARSVEGAVEANKLMVEAGIDPDIDRWVVKEFNLNTLVGVVTCGDVSYKFHSTSFQSDTALRWPREGELVDIALTASGKLLSVHGR